MCRLTSIQILEEPTDEKAGEPPSEDETSIDAMKAVPLWNPCPPTEAGTVHFSTWTNGRATQFSSYFLNMNFGGSDGSKLKLLRGLGVSMNGTLDDFVYGMSFYYGNGDEPQEIYYGSRASYQEINGRPHRLCQKIFPIRGDRGERIVRISVTSSKECLDTDRFLPLGYFGQIRGLQVCRPLMFSMEDLLTRFVRFLRISGGLVLSRCIAGLPKSLPTLVKISNWYRPREKR